MSNYPMMTQSENNKIIVYMTSMDTGIVINNMGCKQDNSYFRAIGTYINYWNSNVFKVIRHVVVPICSKDFNIISARLNEEPDSFSTSI